MEASRDSSPARMTHVAVRCRDVAQSVDFYRRYAGLEIVHEREDHGTRVVWLSHRREQPDFVIVLMDMPHEQVREPCATDHFGFDVESREHVDRIAELARGEGRLKYGPTDAGPIVGYIALVRDPSGNTCEFSHGQSIVPLASA
jgi:catechol 2,3-dioxygenase-like lactoylglutathione lyase family enzyme